jgi:hypothetical protein
MCCPCGSPTGTWLGVSMAESDRRPAGSRRFISCSRESSCAAASPDQEPRSRAAPRTREAKGHAARLQVSPPVKVHLSCLERCWPHVHFRSGLCTRNGPHRTRSPQRCGPPSSGCASLPTAAVRRSLRSRRRPNARAGSLPIRKAGSSLSDTPSAVEHPLVPNLAFRRDLLSTSSWWRATSQPRHCGKAKWSCTHKMPTTSLQLQTSPVISGDEILLLGRVFALPSPGPSEEFNPDRGLDPGWL